MSNSSLVNYTKLSPNHSGARNHSIDTITIHCVVGQCSVETLGSIFADSTREASSNYGVGYDGRVGMYVEEKNRSWCSSSSSNDNRAVTIEVASDTTDPYSVNDKALATTIKLVVDICRRNGIKKLLWKADKSLIGQVSKQNMTVHRWFANKSCPGNYLFNKHTYIANEVNKLLGSSVVNSTINDTSSTPAIKYNSNVKAWQHAMNIGFDFQDIRLEEDGLFGPESIKFASNHVLYKDITKSYNCPTAVRWLQGKIGATQDGVFGNDTYNKLVAYQRKNGLVADGECGLKTYRKLLGL